MSNPYCCGSAKGFSGKNHPTGMLFPIITSLSGIRSANGTDLIGCEVLPGKLVAYPDFRENHSNDDCFCKAAN